MKFQKIVWAKIGLDAEKMIPFIFSHKNRQTDSDFRFDITVNDFKLKFCSEKDNWYEKYLDISRELRRVSVLFSDERFNVIIGFLETSYIDHANGKLTLVISKNVVNLFLSLKKSGKYIRNNKLRSIVGLI